MAWDLEIDNQPASHSAAQSVNPAAILMAVAHREKPFFGIQFDPESICSNANARKVVSAWWTTVQEWDRAHRDKVSQCVGLTLADELRIGQKFCSLEFRVFYNFGGSSRDKRIGNLQNAATRNQKKFFVTDFDLNSTKRRLT